MLVGRDPLGSLRNNATTTPKTETTSTSRCSCPAFTLKLRLQIAGRSEAPAVSSPNFLGRRQPRFHRYRSKPQARSMKYKNPCDRATARPATKHQRCVCRRSRRRSQSASAGCALSVEKAKEKMDRKNEKAEVRLRSSAIHQRSGADTK